MATLAGQRAQFTWALNQYNITDDPDEKDKFASLPNVSIPASR